MASSALSAWMAVGLVRLAELERVHLQATGSAPGRRWGTLQLNRALLVMLVAQFQTYCRDLHDVAVAVHLRESTAAQRDLLDTLLTSGRRIDTGNPRRANLGADFGRLGIDLIGVLKAIGHRTVTDLDHLDALVDYRNAIGHGNEGEALQIEAATGLRATKAQYTRSRQTVDRLARTMDVVVSDQLATLLRIPLPW